MVLRNQEQRLDFLIGHFSLNHVFEINNNTKIWRVEGHPKSR